MHSNDESEQYHRRLCLRINGIELPSPGHKGRLKNAWPKSNSVIDRAYRVGKVVKVKGTEGRQMLVRPTTWRHRTHDLQSPKETGTYKIKLDLTKRRREILRKANEVLVTRNDTFVFADFNCRLCLFRNGEYRYFDDLIDLERLNNK